MEGWDNTMDYIQEDSEVWFGVAARRKSSTIISERLAIYRKKDLGSQ
jgi:hypothetical protein